jgi:hypothetical protein
MEPVNPVFFLKPVAVCAAARSAGPSMVRRCKLVPPEMALYSLTESALFPFHAEPTQGAAWFLTFFPAWSLHLEPFPHLRNVLRNGPEPSRARRCLVRRSEPLTARTVLRESGKRERLSTAGIQKFHATPPLPASTLPRTFFLTAGRRHKRKAPARTERACVGTAE